MTEKEKMLAGNLYNPIDPELIALRNNAAKLIRLYNFTGDDKPELKRNILKELFPASHHLPDLRGPIYFDYGCFTTFGENVFANFNFTCLDVCPVHIGDNVLFGTNVVLSTPVHPLLPDERNLRKKPDGSLYVLEYGKPITIENNCWIASSVTVCAGVTIGEGTVIGAGSIVTRDIPPKCLAFGNPCRVIRQLTDEDRLEGDWC